MTTPRSNPGCRPSAVTRRVMHFSFGRSRRSDPEHKELAMRTRLSRSLACLVTLGFACAMSTGPTAQVIDKTKLLAQPTLTRPTLAFADPNAGIVGRGFNRRVPVTRVYFVADTITGGNGGWKEAGASDRAQCVEFGSLTVPAATLPVSSKTNAVLINSESNFQDASNFGLANKVDASVIVPLEGVPVPLGTNLDRSINGETLVKASQESVNLTVYAEAHIATPIKGNGPAKLRQQVIDDVNAQPDKRRAFFAKCGDRYLDNVVTGGAFAMDISISKIGKSSSKSLDAAIKDSLSVSPGSSTKTATGDGADAAAATAMGKLLNALHITATNNVNFSNDTTLSGLTVHVQISTRVLGPAIDTSSMTIQQALDTMGGWSARIKNNPAQRALISATAVRYQTVDNSSALASALPGELDASYPLLAGQVNGFYLKNYVKLSAWNTLSEDFGSVPAQSRGDNWFDPVAALTPEVVNATRVKALKFTFADAQALECLVDIPPGSPTSTYNACLSQPVLDDGSQSSPVRVRFPRLSKGVPSVNSSSINVVTIGDGLTQYPVLPRRKVAFESGSPASEIVPDLADLGYKIVRVEKHDTSSNPDPCPTSNNNGAKVFTSGANDDFNPLTSSVCCWTLFDGLTLKPGWVAKGKFACGDSSRTNKQSTPGHPAPNPIFDQPTTLIGKLCADKAVSLDRINITLTSVSFEGPLDPENLFGSTTELNLGSFVK